MVVMATFLFLGSQTGHVVKFFGEDREKFVTQAVEQRSNILAEKAAYEVKKTKDSNSS